jgi:hypothetical protein
MEPWNVSEARWCHVSCRKISHSNINILIFSFIFRITRYSYNIQFMGRIYFIYVVPLLAVRLLFLLRSGCDWMFETQVLYFQAGTRVQVAKAMNFLCIRLHRQLLAN